MKVPRLAIALLLGSGASFVHAQSANTLATLQGKYLVGGDGYRVQLLSLLQMPIADSGYIVFDGAGGVTVAKIDENVNGADMVLDETGSYNLNADDSITVKLTGTETRTFNVFPALIDPTTGVAGSLDADDVDTGNGAGDVLPLSGQIMQDPAGDYQQSDFAGVYDVKISGVNELGEKVAGDLELTVDSQGNITGKGHESDNGTNEADTVTGAVTLAPDGSYAGTLSVNGNSQQLLGFLGGLNSLPSLAAATNSVQPQVNNAWYPYRSESNFGTGEERWEWKSHNSPHSIDYW